MQSPPEAAFAPMPLRMRGVLENLDVSIKAYKQYFWVLVGWAGIVNGINSIPFVSYLSYFFTPPLMIGVAACCVAAAVRGQSVSFAQCWRFTLPRYWSIVGMHVCSLLVAGLLAGLLLGVVALIAVGAAYVVGGTPNNLQWIGIVSAWVIGMLVFSVAATAIGAWHSLVAIIACMEDDKRNTQAMARAWHLLQGQWRPVISLMMLLGIGVLVLWAILGASGLFLLGGFQGVRDLMNGTASESRVLSALIGFLASSWFVLTFYLPIYYLAMTLVYLDLRVRKEALDIEWTAHQTAPEPVAMWDQRSLDAPTGNTHLANTPAAFDPMSVHQMPTPPMPAQWAPSSVAPPPNTQPLVDETPVNFPPDVIAPDTSQSTLQAPPTASAPTSTSTLPNANGTIDTPNQAVTTPQAVAPQAVAPTPNPDAPSNLPRW